MQISSTSYMMLQESGKLAFVVELLRGLKANNNRVLIFSQSRKMLDMLDTIFSKTCADFCFLFLANLFELNGLFSLFLSHKYK